MDGVMPMLKDVPACGRAHRTAIGLMASAARLPAALALTLAIWPGPAAGAQTAAAQVQPAFADDVDPAVRPGDDFFGYANGGWLKRTEIPAGMERWNARNEIDALTRRRLAQLLDGAAAAPAGSLARKVAEFEAAYLAEDVIEGKGLAPIAPMLDSIARVRSKAELARLLGRWLRADVDPLNWGIYQSSHLLGLSVEPGLHGEKTNVAFLLQGGLGLPDREYYLGAEPRMRVMRARYQEYIRHQLALAGLERPDQRARGVMALETAIARSQATPEASADDHYAGRVWTRADFARKAPGMDWPAFFTGAGLAAQDTFVAWQPAAVIGAAALVASRPLTVWQDYLRVRLIDRYAAVLPRAFAEPGLALHDTLAARPEPVSRAGRAREVTQAVMAGAVGRLYAERYFPAERKARVEAIVANVREAFARRVDSVPWLSPATRAAALGKLKTLYFGIGYPERWEDYSDLMVDPADAAGNLRRAADRDYRHAVARLGRPVDRRQWWISPQTVAAVLVFQQNAYNFPAALLQAPKFDPEASDAANSGAIGAIVGHEISHFVDLLGRDWDQEGRAGRWWTSADSARFDNAAAALVRQFAGYRPFPDAAVDGGRTRTENVGDLAGLAAAFDAYRRTIAGRVTDPDSVRRLDREFFIGFARSWRSRLRDSALRAQVAGDSHAPERYRIATVRNIDAWYDAFDVRPGQRLYLEPAARVRVW
jgi:predicted metalloendopeptidase